MLSRFRVQGFKSLLDVDIELAPLVVLMGPNAAGKSNLLEALLGESGAPRHEPLGLNHTLVSNRQFTGEHRYPDFDRLRSELSAWQTYYLDPRIEMREPQPPREVKDIGPRGEWIAPFLYRLKESEAHRKYFVAIGRALKAAIPTVERLDVDLDPRRGTLDIVIHQDGTPYSSRVVSEGTLRVLALCCLAGNPWPGELIAFEEPETGVHPRRIDVIADLLASMAQQGRSQVVVTTHSPTLIAAMHRRAQAAPDLIRIFQCSQQGRATEVRTLIGPLFVDEVTLLDRANMSCAGSNSIPVHILPALCESRLW